MRTETGVPAWPLDASASDMAAGSVRATQLAVGSPEFSSSGPTSTATPPMGALRAKEDRAKAAGGIVTAASEKIAARRVRRIADMGMISSKTGAAARLLAAPLEIRAERLSGCALRKDIPSFKPIRWTLRRPAAAKILTTS